MVQQSHLVGRDVGFWNNRRVSYCGELFLWLALDCCVSGPKLLLLYQCIALNGGFSTFLSAITQFSNQMQCAPFALMKIAFPVQEVLGTSTHSLDLIHDVK